MLIIGIQQGVKSTEFPGFLKTPDGTYILTEQFKTWHKLNSSREGKAPSLQLEKNYPNSSDPNWVHPIGFPGSPKLDKSWHPQVSSLCLEFSHEGSWVRVPRRVDDTTGPDYKDFYIARREKYIDEEGQIKYAICYKRSHKEMSIWFREEEMREALVNWVIPEVPYYYNMKVYDGNLRK